MTDGLSTIIQSAWASVLAGPRIDADSNFFELGGTSLDGSHMLAEIRRRVGVPVRIRDLLENPTLEQFTGRVRTLAGSLSASGQRTPPDRSAPGRD